MGRRSSPRRIDVRELVELLVRHTRGAVGSRPGRFAPEKSLPDAGQHILALHRLVIVGQAVKANVIFA